MADGSASPLVLRVVAIPRLALGGKWRVETLCVHAEPVLLWFTKGQGRITLQGWSRGYSPNTAVFMPAGTMHGFEIGPQVFGWAVFFGNRDLPPLPDEPQILRPRDVQSQHELSVLIDAISRESVSDQPGAARAAVAQAGLASVWLERQMARQPAEEPDAARRLVARFSTLMEAEFRKGAGVGELAEMLGVTTTHLSRCCRLAGGRSAIDLLQDRRLSEARRLLVETDLPVHDIAAQVGFSSAAYFTRAFQQETGLAPSAFRKAG